MICMVWSAGYFLVGQKLHIGKKLGHDLIVISSVQVAFDRTGGGDTVKTALPSEDGGPGK